MKMTKEEKAAIAAAAEAENTEAEEEEADADDIAEEPIEGADATEAGKEDLSEPDYEALLKAETDRANAAEKAAAALAFSHRKGKRDGKQEEAEDDDEEEDDDDKPLTRREAREFMSAQGAVLQKTAQEREALAIARENTSTEAEAQAALLFFKNRVIPTGNLEDDVLFAIGGINRKKAVGKAQELARAVISKDTAHRSSATAHRSGTPSKEPTISPQDAFAIKKAGLAWDGALRVYKKKLGNGSKHLYFDPKTKKRWTAA